MLSRGVQCTLYRMDLFFDRNVPHIVTRIFTLLDPVSLDNCLLVCKSWNEFIVENILSVSKLRKEVDSKQLSATWLLRRSRNLALDCRNVKEPASVWCDREEIFVLSKVQTRLKHISVFGKSGKLKRTISLGHQSIQEDAYLVFTERSVLLNCESSGFCFVYDRRNNFNGIQVSVPNRNQGYSYGIFGKIQSCESGFFYLSAETISHYIYKADVLTVCRLSDGNGIAQFDSAFCLDIPRFARHYGNCPGRHSLCPLDDGEPRMAMNEGSLLLACRHGYIGLYKLEGECEPSLHYFIRHTEKVFGSVQELFIQENYFGVTFGGGKSQSNPMSSTIQVFEKATGELMFTSQHQSTICITRQIHLRNQLILVKNDKGKKSLVISNVEGTCTELDFQVESLICIGCVQDRILLLAAKMTKDEENGCIIAIDIQSKDSPDMKMRILPKVTTRMKGDLFGVLSGHSFVCVNGVGRVELVEFPRFSSVI